MKLALRADRGGNFPRTLPREVPMARTTMSIAACNRVPLSPSGRPIAVRHLENAGLRIRRGHSR